MLSERNSLSEALKQKELEKEQLRAENLALRTQNLELLSRLSSSAPPTGEEGPTAAPQSIYPRTTAADLQRSLESEPQSEATALDDRELQDERIKAQT